MNLVTYNSLNSLFFKYRIYEDVIIKFKHRVILVLIKSNEPGINKNRGCRYLKNKNIPQKHMLVASRFM